MTGINRGVFPTVMVLNSRISRADMLDLEL
jgi:hypothetical protein